MSPGLYGSPDRYDLIYSDFRADIDFYLELAHGVEGPVCDLGCGTGRVTLPLAESFPSSRFYGVDNAPEQLSRAVAAGKNRGIENLSWACTPMESARLPERCSLVFSALHSLEHLTEEEQVDRFFYHLREKLLEPGGFFAAALHLPDPRYLSAGPEETELVGAYGGASDGVTLYERRTYDAATQILSLTWFFDDGGDGELDETHYDLRLFYPREIRRILRQHGFQLLGQWGWYDRSELTAKSGTQVILAQAPS